MVEALATRLSERPNVFITSVDRLPATESDTLRKQLFASQASLLVVGRRLGARALAPLNLTGLQELLQGSVGLVLSGDDVVPVAKVIVEFQRSHEERLSVRGAVIDGQLLDRKRVEQLAGLPPKPMLLAQVVATVEGPLAAVIFTIEHLIDEVAWIVEQLAAKPPAPAPTTPQEPAGAPTEEPPSPGATEAPG